MASIRKRQWTTAKGEIRKGWAVDFVDRQGNRQRRQFTSRAEADDFRIEIEGQLRSGTFRPEAAKVTVKQVAEQFLAHCEGRLRRRERMTRHNFKTYEGHVYNYICPDLARRDPRKRNRRQRPFTDGLSNSTLAQLTPRGVSEFRDRLRDAGVSVVTTRKILGTLKVMLEYAITQDLIAFNAARRIKVIGRRDEGAKKIVPPSKHAMRQLLDEADPDFRIKLIVAAATGVRAGEFHALRWRHNDFSRGEVTIETRVDAYREEDVTKTEAGMRTVPLAASVITALREWRKRAPYDADDDLVFPNRKGSYENHDNMVKRQFKPLFDRLASRHADDPERHPAPPKFFNWHALRHFAISCWIEAGLSPKTVQTFAGHSSLQVTMDRYGHLFPAESHATAMDAIADALVAGGPERASRVPKNLSITKEFSP